MHIINIEVVDDEELSLFEQQLLVQAKRLNPNDLRKLAAQAKALADLS